MVIWVIMIASIQNEITIPLTPSYGLFFVKVEIHFEMWYFFRTETKFKFGCHISNTVTNVILKTVKRMTKEAK